MTPEEMELRIKHLEKMILELHYNAERNHGMAPARTLGICVNHAIHYSDPEFYGPPQGHPHYIEPPSVQWEKATIIYLPTRE
jgi:hypothetical protein